ncbi:pteridine reductase [Ectothiorhodospira lacustris]|uniref:pteridine reductase n=1 Tax=Ectothiorhodospira lacustris TaxID=2899127 RepID=UPI001EE80748|nr:pteridine reductase [Ectothiorhodospira lacustris]MCG5510585.1 pteridine reductase [Ectothiorhodospira lacustris]MCG5521277.1 pteridine reductase [Ectothiorhodospira lacustris]
MAQPDTPSLQGKTVFITGGARRIGAAIARRLHAQGMNLVIHYRRSSDDARALQDALEQRRANSVTLVGGELLEPGATERLAREAAAAFGGLDVLINNASTFYPTPLGRITEAHWDDLMGTNLKAPLFLSQALAPALTAREGCIINIVDIHALRPLKDYPVYCAAKAGLWLLTQSLARELGPRVRVNGIAPGAILWPEAEENAASHKEMIQRTALKREGGPDDIARTALFLIRDADYITGQVIAVDGGRTTAQ